MFAGKIPLSILLILCVFGAMAQPKKPGIYKQPRILILLDGSSSMVNEWTKGKTRFDAAGEIVLKLMDSIYRFNDQVEFSLRVYGHQYDVPENNCGDTRREVMFSKNNYTQMSLRLSSLHPRGVSPIAYSLEQAAESDFTDERDYAYSLVLITDGGESCGGNICSVVQSLLEKKIEFKPYIISLVDYAPLKEQYKCLGNYLMASKPSEVTGTVSAIADAYRKVLAIPIAKSKLPEQTRIPAPSVQKISVPPVRVPVSRPETTAVQQPVITPAPEKRAPEPVAAPPSSSKIKVESSFFAREKYSRVKSLGLDRVHYTLFWSTTTPKKRAVPKMELPAKETEPPAPKPAVPEKTTTAPPRPKPTTIAKVPTIQPQAKEAAFTVKTEPAKETTIEVLFTDGKGKYYTTTPPVELLDAATGATIKKFYRTVDANGQPDPQPLMPGNYILRIGSNGNFKTKAVSINGATRNVVTIVVTRGTLIFRYDENYTRPVSEFMASVRKTFEAGTNVVQKCTEQREYEPGNYHVEINTLPMMIRNIDLEFGWSYTIDIPEPGWIQFTNTNAKGRITLWSVLGDQFAKFYALEISGNPQTQKVKLLPGYYEVHWKENTGRPYEPEKIEKFFVRSNQTTELEIK